MATSAAETAVINLHDLVADALQAPTRGRCACGYRVGYMTALPQREARRNMQDHATKAYRTAKRKGLPHLDHAITYETVTPEMQAAEKAQQAAQEVQWLERHVADRRESLLEACDKVAANLRRMADDVARVVQRARESAGSVTPWGSNDPANIVQEVQHAALWGMANLNLDSLTTYYRDLALTEKRLAGKRQAADNG